MNEIRKILNIISEIELDPNKELLEKLYSELTQSVSTVYNSYKNITEDYTIPSWIVFRELFVYSEIQHQVITLHEELIAVVPENAQTYEILTILYKYFIDEQ